MLPGAGSASAAGSTRSPEYPIIMLTALGEDINRIVGLDEAFGPRIMRALMFQNRVT